MSIETIQMKKWNERQLKLRNFLSKTEPVWGDEIREWIAESIVHFTEIGVPQNIVSYFLEKMEHVSIKGEKIPDSPLVFVGVQPVLNKEEENSFIGPFQYIKNEGYQINSENRLTNKSGGKVKMTPVLVAFEVAQNLINTYKDSNSIVPNILITELEKYTETKALSLSLKTIQTNFEKNNMNSMLTGVTTSTELTLNQISELTNCTKLKPKIQKAYDTKAIYIKYSINREVLWALNNSRIIRNHNEHGLSTSNNTTTYEAISYTHLLCLLISSILSSGNLILTKE